MPMRRSSAVWRPIFFLPALFLLLSSAVSGPASANPFQTPLRTRFKMRVRPPLTVHVKKSPVKKAPLTAPTAESLFVKVLRSDDLYPYKGRQVTTYWRTGRVMEVMVFHRPTDDSRIQFLNPEIERGRLLVSDGTQQWEYDPHQKVLRHRRLSLGALDDDDLLSYTLLRANYLLTVDPKPHLIADRKTYLVTINRPLGQTLARRFWIDAGSGLILKREIYRDDGKLAVTVTFSDIAYHMTLAPALFTLSSLAKTMRVAELPTTETAIPLSSLHRQLAGKASAPGSLAGYRLVGATTTKIGERPVLHLRYSDGLNLVSLFEERRTQPSRPTLVPPGLRVTQIGATPVHISHRASLTTLNWDTPALNTTLMGEMGLSTLCTLAGAAIQAR
jgi:outer membrane lipoprotein-sorting protein